MLSSTNWAKLGKISMWWLLSCKNQKNYKEKSGKENNCKNEEHVNLPITGCFGTLWIVYMSTMTNSNTIFELFITK